MRKKKTIFQCTMTPTQHLFLFKLLSAVIFKTYSLSPAFYHLNSLVTTKTVKTEFSCMMITDFRLHNIDTLGLNKTSWIKANVKIKVLKILRFVTYLLTSAWERSLKMFLSRNIYLSCCFLYVDTFEGYGTIIYTIGFIIIVLRQLNSNIEDSLSFSNKQLQIAVKTRNALYEAYILKETKHEK